MLTKEQRKVSDKIDKAHDQFYETLDKFKSLREDVEQIQSDLFEISENITELAAKVGERIHIDGMELGPLMWRGVKRSEYDNFFANKKQ